MRRSGSTVENHSMSKQGCRLIYERLERGRIATTEKAGAALTEYQGCSCLFSLCGIGRRSVRSRVDRCCDQQGLTFTSQRTAIGCLRGITCIFEKLRGPWRGSVNYAMRASAGVLSGIVREAMIRFLYKIEIRRRNIAMVNSPYAAMKSKVNLSNRAPE